MTLCLGSKINALMMMVSNLAIMDGGMCVQYSCARRNEGRKDLSWTEAKRQTCSSFPPRDPDLTMNRLGLRYLLAIKILDINVNLRLRNQKFVYIDIIYYTFFNPLLLIPILDLELTFYKFFYKKRKRSL